jgi:hypothetical protein
MPLTFMPEILRTHGVPELFQTHKGY